MKKIAFNLRSHRELLLNYFRARKAYSSGVIEGCRSQLPPTVSTDDPSFGSLLVER